MPDGDHPQRRPTAQTELLGEGEGFVRLRRVVERDRDDPNSIAPRELARGDSNGTRRSAHELGYDASGTGAGDDRMMGGAEDEQPDVGVGGNDLVQDACR